MPKRNDHLLLMDIFEAGEKIIRFTSGYTFEDYLNDEKTIDAVIRNFQVIGEASRHISLQMMEQNSAVEWSKMRGLRNILVHQYFGVNHKVIWETIQNFLPQTIEAIKQIIHKEDL